MPTPRREARGAEILLEILRSEGVKFIFGNPGTTELPLIDELVVNPDFRYVLGLQESSAVGMADGYAQASGKPAFINLHTSGGLGHGMGAIINARIARVPMVITAGQQDLRHILADPLRSFAPAPRRLPAGRRGSLRKSLYAVDAPLDRRAPIFPQ
jgi:benzoylformate decarboxylase